MASDRLPSDCRVFDLPSQPSTPGVGGSTTPKTFGARCWCLIVSTVCFAIPPHSFFFKSFSNAKITGGTVSGTQRQAGGKMLARQQQLPGKDKITRKGFDFAPSFPRFIALRLDCRLVVVVVVAGIPIPSPLPLPLAVFPGALIWTMCRQIYSYSGLLA